MKDIDKLFSDLFDLQRQGLVVDTRLVVDDGEVAIQDLFYFLANEPVGFMFMLKKRK